MEYYSCSNCSNRLTSLCNSCSGKSNFSCIRTSMECEEDRLFRDRTNNSNALYEYYLYNHV